MFNRLTKAGEVLAYVGLGYISYLFISGHFDLHFSRACALLSGLWLTLTAVQLKTLLRTYFDMLSRLKVRTTGKRFDSHQRPRGHNSA